MPIVKQAGARPSPGLTLVEVLVVLVLLGLGFALAAPSFLSVPRARDDAAQRVIDVARRAAVQRAGAVRLSFAADGSWVVEGLSARDPAPLLSGRLASPHGQVLRLRISPLGACTLDSSPAVPRSLTIDPVRCRLAGWPDS
jgi:prepilin-type N-terminal cleavage/methylation domain-containing protein